MKKMLWIGLMVVTLGVTGQNNETGKYLPLPLPDWSEPVSHSDNAHYLLGYDVLTGIEFVADTAGYYDDEDILTTIPLNPEYSVFSGEEGSADSFSGLEYVTSPAQYPYSANVKIFIEFPGQAYYVGSGVMVAKNVMLTAGHCIYDKRHGGWALNIRVVPAYDNGSEPFGSAYATRLHTWTAWTSDENYEWDLGIVLLDRNIGNQSGAYGYGTNNDTFYKTAGFWNMGYPADYPYNGQAMYKRSGNFDNTNEHIVYFNDISYGGQSGSACYHKFEGGDRCIYAILSHGNDYQTGCTRITSAKFSHIGEVIQSGTTMSVSKINPEVGPAFSVYPVPATDRIHLELMEDHTVCTVNIYDLLGKCLSRGTLEPDENKTILPVDQLSPGFYFITVSDGFRVSTRSFIKENN